MLYLDNAATTRKKPYSVYGAMLKYYLFCGGNSGRGANKLSLSGINAMISAQETVARLFGVTDEKNVIFTHNATYALNMAILGTLSPSDHIVVTAMDHNSVLRPAALHGNYSVAEADKYGFVSPLSIRRKIKSNTKLVICTHISNVCGTIEPISEIARTAHENNALFLLDASQSAGALNIDMEKMNIDMLACPGHKGLMGPMGTGILCIKAPEKVKAVIVGGTGSNSEQVYQPEIMPDKFHSGTLNTPALAGLNKGISFVLKEGADTIGNYEHHLNSNLRREISQMKNIVLYGKGDSSITSFNILGKSSEETAQALGDNIIVRAGYHCAPLAHKALGTESIGTVRISFGYFNTENDVKKIVRAIYNISKE